MRSPILMMMMMMMMMMTTTWVAGQDTQNCTGCYTKQCISVTEAALHGVDDSVDPCDNFYKYACGGWMQNQFLTPERQRINFRDTGIPLGATRNLLTQSIKDGDHIAVIKAKSLYHSCYNYATGTSSSLVQTVTNMASVWTFGCSDCDTSRFNLEDFLFKAICIDVHPLFKLSARVENVEAVDATNRVKQYLFIDEPTMQFPVFDYYYLMAEPQLSAIYADKIVDALSRFGTINETLAREDARAVVEAEKDISYILLRNMHGSQTTKSSLNLVDVNYGQLMNWTRVVKRIAAMEEIGILDIAFNETVYIKGPNGLNSTISYFLSLPRRTQINFLMWRVVDSLESFLVLPTDKINDIILYHAQDPMDREYRVEPCVWFVTKVFPLVVHRMLYAEHLPLQKIQKVNLMVQQIQYEFTSQLGEHHWLDQNARRVIQEKMDSITTVVSYFREAMNETFVDYYYRNATVGLLNDSVRRDFLYNIPIVRKDAFAKNFRSIRQPLRWDQNTLPQIFNMFNVIKLHQIVFTPSVFQYPWFLDEAPMVVNYAGLGSAIAHELVHSFDRDGIKIHANGTKGTWFGNATTAEFNARVRCLINQYSSFWYKSARMNVNGDLTVIENIADSGLFRLAYKAYLNYTNTVTTRDLNFTYLPFSNDKLFFIRAAQLWCQKETFGKAKETINGRYSPTEFRVNGPLQNFVEFADVFRCPSGSPMNPVNKCVIW